MGQEGRVLDLIPPRFWERMKMIKIDTSGLDELQRKLETLSGTHEISSNDLMTNEFISSETKFSSWEEMMEKGGVKCSEDIQGEVFADFIRSNTKFESFEDMAGEAASLYFAKKLSAE